MFAPDHQRTADEIIRVTRPGGTVGLASWTPDGFIGEMFRRHHLRTCPAPPGVASPLLWGTEEHLTDLFGPDAPTHRVAGARLHLRFTSREFVSRPFPCHLVEGLDVRHSVRQD